MHASAYDPIRDDLYLGNQYGEVGGWGGRAGHYEAEVR